MVKDVEIGEKKERELLIFIEGWRKVSFITLTSSSTTYICVKMNKSYTVHCIFILIFPSRCWD